MKIIHSLSYIGIGVVLATMSCSYTTWQFWAILGLLLLLDQISRRIGRGQRKGKPLAELAEAIRSAIGDGYWVTIDINYQHRVVRLIISNPTGPRLGRLLTIEALSVLTEGGIKAFIQDMQRDAERYGEKTMKKSPDPSLGPDRN